MNTIVNFEIAKLLKEKGYDEECDYTYLVAGKYGLIANLNVKPNDIILIDMSKQKLCNTLKNTIYKEHVTLGVSNYITSAPTIVDVIMWLYEKHNIWVVVNVGKPHNCGIMMYANVIKFGLHHKCKYKTIFYNTPLEAYSDAIQYVLKDLLK